MSSSDPCLLAVLLVTQARTGSGAQIVFHYPPNPLSDPEVKARDANSPRLDESSSSDSDSESSSDENDVALKQTKPRAQRRHDPPVQASDDDEEYRDPASRVPSHQKGKPPWDPLLGLGEEALISLLAPGRAWHKRKFEMSINDLVFVGRPVYARRSGTWHRRRRRHADTSVEDQQEPDSDVPTTDSDQDGPSKPTKAAPDRHSGRRSQLTMFHVVFVLDPQPLEHAIKVKEMYENVARKISKVLKSEQAQTEYVWKQSDLIQNIKHAGLAKLIPTPTLYADILAQSSLAMAIQTIFKSISTSRIAAIKLSQDISVSLQIPPITSVSYLPPLSDPPIQPGLWLTTSNDSPSSASELDTATASGALQLAKQFSLLLKESPQKIVKEIQSTGGPLALPLTTFIDKARPTKSFYKISLANQISLADIQLLAQHLIYWRRAIAVPPLHHRDTFIVSPNADMSKLLDASKSFESAFPMMPSLPRLLNLLSQTPIPFGILIPSSDHKDEYYRVLAWLLRGGWVTQLRTFAYVRVSPSIKRSVREKDKEERGQRTQTSSPEKDQQSQPSSRRPSMPSRPSSEGHSISTSTSHSQSRQKHTTTSTNMSNPHLSSLILSPLRASALESRYLSAISDSVTNSTSLTQQEKEELRIHWPILVKYFNGAEPLEMVPIREGLKRKGVWDMLRQMGLRFEGGVRNEGGDERGGEGGGGRKGGKRGVLVGVRHW